VTSAYGRRFLALVGRQHGIEPSPGAADDGVDLGLHLLPDGPELPSLPIHDGVDPDLLLGRQPDFLGESLPEFPITGWMPPRPVLEPWTAHHSGQEHHPVQGDPSQAAAEGYEEQHQTGQQPAARLPGRWGSTH
jgi:hypothetical protein